ncbi:MAG TPA: glycerol-3-phosphate acyltransferase, partial [Candidatus Obscuribacterales bacterium]
MLTLTQVWGALLILLVCPGLGAVPLTPWLMQRWPVGDRPAPPVKTVGVATAFAQGGAIAGSLALALEAAKGIGAVLLARHYFPADPEWEVIALMALVMGRYWGAQAVGTTSVLWGALVHSPIAAGLTLLISLLGFTIFRERQQGRLLVLVLFTVLTALQVPDGVRVLLTACLCALIGWIYQKMPADVDLPAPASRLESQRLWGFFRSDRALLALGQSLQPGTVGGKAMRLSQLLAAGYPVPPGDVLPAGDDPALLIEITHPAPTTPVIVRASAIDDQPALATSAGQYAAVADITSQEALFAAMSQVFRSYDR